MCTANKCIELLYKHRSHIQHEYGVNEMCIFGSTARGTNRDDSDIDILVDMPPKMTSVMQLKEYLEELLDSSVDLVRRHSHLSQKFLTSIGRDAIKVF